MDDGDGTAPEALPGQEPVAQAELDGATPGAVGFEFVDHATNARDLVGESVEYLGVAVRAVADGGHASLSRVGAVDVEDDAHGQPELASEVEISLIVCRNSHHGTRAVVGQHVVSGPDGNLFAVDRVHGVGPEEYAGLLSLGGLSLDFRGLLGSLDVGVELSLVLFGDELGGQFGVGRDDDVGGTVESVRTRGEHRDGLVATVDMEIDVGAFGAADPVALHRQHVFGPAVLQLLHIVEQAVGVVGDLEVPLVELAFGDLGLAALAAPVHHLLVREHGLVFRAPVDVGVFPVGQAALVEPQEEPLGPAVVLLVGGVQAPGPVEAETVALKGASLRLDVVVRPLGRVRVVADGRVLGGQAERVPADGMEHVVALQPQVARHHVAHRIGLCVAHVQITRRVREHVEHVAAFTLAVVVRFERLVLLPESLPLLLGCFPVVVLATHVDPPVHGAGPIYRAQCGVGVG